LISEEFGFQSGTSTDDASFRLTDKVLEPSNRKTHIVGIFCDLAKAFDNVNQDVSLNKLHFVAFKK
jgi:hypothetical protein